MLTASVKNTLDEYFRIRDYKETVWSAIAKGLNHEFPAFTYEGFKENGTGLFIKAKEDINGVFVAAFLSEFVAEEAIKAANGPSLLICKHPMEWEEFDTGFIPLRQETYQRFLDAGMSVYIPHMALDNHPAHSPSMHFCAQIGATDLEGVSYTVGNAVHQFGYIANAPVGLNSYESFVKHVARSMGLDDVQRIKSHDNVGKLVVVTGGGDNLNWALSAIEKIGGGDVTYVTGIAYFRGTPYSAVHNLEFVEYCKERGINLIGAGHYPTEIAGVRSFNDELDAMLGLPVKLIEEKQKMQLLQNKWGGNFYDR
ncbi:MAG: Nif3-like dinuclear metal center hexameric protein [archaeon]